MGGEHPGEGFLKLGSVSDPGSSNGAQWRSFVADGVLDPRRDRSRRGTLSKAGSFVTDGVPSSKAGSFVPDGVLDQRRDRSWQTGCVIIGGVVRDRRGTLSKAGSFVTDGVLH